MAYRTKRQRLRDKDDSDAHRESVELFMDNLDDPDLGLNKVCFIWNSVDPQLNNINAVIRIEEDNNVIDDVLNTDRQLLVKRPFNGQNREDYKIQLHQVQKSSEDNSDELSRASPESKLEKLKNMEPEKRGAHLNSKGSDKVEEDQSKCPPKEVNTSNTKVILSKTPTVNTALKLLTPDVDQGGSKVSEQSCKSV